MSILTIGIFCLVSCDDNGNSYTATSDKCYKNIWPSTDVESVFTSADKLIVAGRDDVISVWKWDNLDAEPQTYQSSSPWVACLASGKLVESVFKRNNPEQDIIITDIEGKIYNKWPKGKDWYCPIMINSYNGNHIVLILEENMIVARRRKNDKKSYGTYRFGVINEDSDAIDWITTIDIDNSGPTVHGLSISAKGDLVAACGLLEGGWVMVVDVQKKKVLWDINPSWAVNFNALSISTDSKAVYIGGNGGLYHFDLATGEIDWHWSEFESRIVGVAVSPDGRLVAAGAVASGRLYIVDTQTGKTLKEYQTGQYSLYNVAFSPDSKFVVTEGVKSTGIKIWKMPEVAK